MPSRNDFNNPGNYVQNFQNQGFRIKSSIGKRNSYITSNVRIYFMRVMIILPWSDQWSLLKRYDDEANWHRNGWIIPISDNDTIRYVIEKNNSNNLWKLIRCQVDFDVVTKPIFSFLLSHFWSMQVPGLKNGLLN